MSKKLPKKFVIFYLLLGILTRIIPAYICWILIQPTAPISWIIFIIATLILGSILFGIGFLILIKIFSKELNDTTLLSKQDTQWKQ